MGNSTTSALARILCKPQFTTSTSVSPNVIIRQLLRSDARHVHRNSRWASTSASASTATSSSRSQSIPQSGKRQWSTPLAETLAKYITTAGPISVAAYMRQCLTSSEGGYYTSTVTSPHHITTAATTSSSFDINAPKDLTQKNESDQFGIKGDFITSPEISQVFGELVGVWIVAEWLAQGGPKSISRGRGRSVQLIELGPGRGTLMDDMLRAISTFKQLWSVLDTIYLVEASPSLREKQRHLLCGSNEMTNIDIGFQSHSKLSTNLKIVWVEDFGMIPEASDATPFIVAHEFFDALPIHAFQSIPCTIEGNSVTSSPNQKEPPYSSSSAPMTSGQKLSKESLWRELLVITDDPSSSSMRFTSSERASESPEFQLTLSKQHTYYSKVLPNNSQRYKALENQPGSVIEISPEAFKIIGLMAQRIGGTITHPLSSSSSLSSPSSSSSLSPKTIPDPSGAALILDYGPSHTIPANSLRGIRSHELVSPFTAPGTVDISADVDFTGLADAALDASPNVEVHGPVSQSAWLRNMGGRERIEALMMTTKKKKETTTERTDAEKSTSTDKSAEANGTTTNMTTIVEDENGELEEARRKRLMDAWLRLVDEGPQGMGRLYKVMAIVPYTHAADVEGGGQHKIRALAGFEDG